MNRDVASIPAPQPTDLMDWRRAVPSEFVHVGRDLGIDEFCSEELRQPRIPDEHQRPGAWHHRTALPLVTGVAVFEALALFGVGLYLSGMLHAPTGTLVVESQPPGLQVVVDGKRVGTTPTQLTVPAGDHAVEWRLGTHKRGMALHVGRHQTTRARVDVVAPPIVPAAPEAALVTGYSIGLPTR